MSVDLYFRCKAKPTLEKVETVIFPLGWRKQEYFTGYKEPSYLWFHQENYESTRGCWLFVNKPDSGDPKGTRIVFHAYSNAGRSYEDLEAQNQVIRSLRKVFGGSLYNPQEGNSSYLYNDLPRLRPSEKACGFVYINYQQNLGRASLIVADVSEKAKKMKQLDEWTITWDKGILKNNTTLPFLVSCLESFLREFFVAYVETHPDIKERIYEKTAKIEYRQLRDLLSGKKTLAELEAENYTFQNLYSAHAAYKAYIGVDIFDILNKRRRVGKTSRIVRDVIQEILELRHKIVHTAFLDIDLNKERMDTYIGYLRKAGQLFVNKFLAEKNFRIDLEEYV